MAPTGAEGEQREQQSGGLSAYDIPWITPTLRRWKWTKYMPFLPTFQEDCGNNCCRGSRDEPEYDQTAQRDEVTAV